MGWYAVARGLVEPYVQFFRIIPPLAIIPLAVVTQGIGEIIAPDPTQSLEGNRGGIIAALNSVVFFTA